MSGANEPLTTERQQAIHRLAWRVVRSRVLGLSGEVGDDDLAGAADRQVWGAFVTLKRQGQLRSCCGHVGGGTLREAVGQAALRAATEDMRLPAIAPRELEFLDLDVTVLDQLQEIPASGDARAEAVTPGAHGVCLKRGQSSALFLPQVAAENGWDSRRLLGELCAKAGLAAVAWKQSDVQLWTFVGTQIHGQQPEDLLSHEGRPAFTVPEVEALAEHCRNNLAAAIGGGVTCYYLPGGPDGGVNGIVLSVHHRGTEVLTANQFELLKTLPLQSAVFQLVEAAAANLRQQGATPGWAGECRVSLTLLTAPGMHGSAARPDLRGIDSAEHAVLVTHHGSSSWTRDAAKSADDLLSDALAPLASADREEVRVFSLAAVSNRAQVQGASVARPIVKSGVRPPAVAGSFYPDDPQQLAGLVDDLLAERAATTRRAGAVMVPHAGLRFSGKLAAATLAAVEIPQTVIVIGPKHTRLGVDWAVAPHDVWQLPGMAVPSDAALARRLAEAIPGLELDAAAHEREHAIEVELPLIARLAPAARVVGIVLGSGSLQRCRAFAAGLAEVIKGLANKPLLVISSDMNHFANDADTRELDALALEQLERLDPEGLLRTVHEHHISMCGVLPAVVVLETLKLLGRLGSCRRTGYATSAETSGDASRVVGYAGMTFGP